MVGFILLHGVLPVVVFALAFLIEKKPWRGYKSFADWEARIVKKLKGSGDWIRKQLQNLKELVLKLVLALWAKRPPLKPLYIIFATFIGFVILYLFVIICLKIYWIGWETIATDDSKTRNYAIAFIGLVSGFGALFGVYLAIQRTEESKRQSKSAEREADTAEQRLITDQLNKATEGMGKSNQKDAPVIEVRLGALYALERIAKGSAPDHAQIIEILCAYIRSNSPKYKETDEMKEPMDIQTTISHDWMKKKPSGELREDIQTAVTVIGRRELWLEGKEKEGLLKYLLNLRECDLSNCYFYNSDLSSSALMGTNLNNARFINTNLRRAWMNLANMNGVIIKNADMYKANLECSFSYDGNFFESKNLAQEQLDMMYCGIKVKIPRDLTRPEHWPSENISYDKFVKRYLIWLQPYIS